MSRRPAGRAADLDISICHQGGGGSKDLAWRVPHTLRWKSQRAEWARPGSLGTLRGPMAGPTSWAAPPAKLHFQKLRPQGLEGEAKAQQTAGPSEGPSSPHPTPMRAGSHPWPLQGTPLDSVAIHHPPVRRSHRPLPGKLLERKRTRREERYHTSECQGLPFPICLRQLRSLAQTGMR